MYRLMMVASECNPPEDIFHSFTAADDFLDGLRVYAREYTSKL